MEMDGGDSCMILWLNAKMVKMVYFKMVKMIIFMFCVFY